MKPWIKVYDIDIHQLYFQAKMYRKLRFIRYIYEKIVWNLKL